MWSVVSPLYCTGPSCNRIRYHTLISNRSFKSKYEAVGKEWVQLSGAVVSAKYRAQKKLIYFGKQRQTVASLGTFDLLLNEQLLKHTVGYCPVNYRKWVNALQVEKFYEMEAEERKKEICSKVVAYKWKVVSNPRCSQVDEGSSLLCLIVPITYAVYDMT